MSVVTKDVTCNGENKKVFDLRTGCNNKDKQET
jgi:hypothetical protein